MSDTRAANPASRATPEKDRLEWGRQQAEILWGGFCAGFDPVVKRQTVLDFGCSWGYFAKYLVDRFAPRRVIGVDLAPYWDTVDHGWDWRRHGERLAFIAGDVAESSAIPPGSVDLVIAISVFQYLPPGKLQAVLAKLYSLLRPGGEMLVRTRVFTSYIGADLHAQFSLPYVHLLYPKRDLDAFASERRGERPRYLNALTASSYLFLFHQAGFELAEIRRRMNRAAPEILAQVRERYPVVAEAELFCAEIEARLLRPYEPEELDAITSAVRVRGPNEG
ncbi:MAG: class I SAM-dependent methyltransferase [Alphaproteobacteria bacterium]|nr:class I SAM-dependent methyltransferase [Alphaproteobacteria bacterium]